MQLTVRGRRGFTLIELMVGLVLVGIVGAALSQLMLRTQRLSRTQAERVAMQGNMRGAAAILPAELREVGYDYGTRDSTDLLAIAPDSIAFRAVRASGVVCAMTPAASTVIVVDTVRRYSALRGPVAGRDRLMLFAERDPNKSSDDLWVRKGITAVAPGVCSAAFGARPGLALTTTLASSALADTSVVVGAPLRTSEVMVYKLYQTGGRWYLGVYSATDPASPGIQPLVGPLAANGFRLQYFDEAGAATAVRANVRSVRITLVAESEQRVSRAGAGSLAMATDSLVTLVTLRNSLR